jgi:tetratricopeptide (TPR) repeat protein
MGKIMGKSIINNNNEEYLGLKAAFEDYDTLQNHLEKEYTNSTQDVFLKMCTTIADKFSEESIILENMGRIIFDLEDNDPKIINIAVQLLRKSVELLPNEEALYYLCDYFLSEEKLLEANQYITIAFNNGFNNDSFLNFYGKLMEKESKLESALQYFNAAYNQAYDDESSFEIALNLANIHKLLRQYDMAHDYLILANWVIPVVNLEEQLAELDSFQGNRVVWTTEAELTGLDSMELN